jgi:hypothetical protein
MATVASIVRSYLGFVEGFVFDRERFGPLLDHGLYKGLERWILDVGVVDEFAQEFIMRTSIQVFEIGILCSTHPLCSF